MSSKKFRPKVKSLHIKVSIHFIATILIVSRLLKVTNSTNFKKSSIEKEASKKDDHKTKDRSSNVTKHRKYSLGVQTEKAPAAKVSPLYADPCYVTTRVVNEPSQTRKLLTALVITCAVLRTRRGRGTPRCRTSATRRGTRRPPRRPAPGPTCRSGAGGRTASPSRSSLPPRGRTAARASSTRARAACRPRPPTSTCQVTHPGLCYKL